MMIGPWLTLPSVDCLTEQHRRQRSLGFVLSRRAVEYREGGYFYCEYVSLQVRDAVSYL